MAAAAVRGKDGWAATELDLGGVADVEEVADRLRDVDPYADVSLLFVEAEDTYLVIMRLDSGEDMRVFGSDSAFAHESRLGGLLLGDIDNPAREVEQALAEAEAATRAEAAGSGTAPDAGTGEPDPADPADEEDEPTTNPAADPVGDADLLADLGMSAHRLLTTCARDGMLPADVTAEVGYAIGCGDELEELRET